MPGIKKFNFANHVASSSDSQISEETNQISQLSSNGFKFTYKIHEIDPTSERIEGLKIHAEVLEQAAPLISSFKTNQNKDTPVQITEVFMYKETHQGLEYVAAKGMSPKFIETALNENRLFRIKENANRELEFGGDKELEEALRRTEQRGKAVYRRNLDGSIIEIKNFTFKELSESEQRLLRNSIIIYLIYLENIEEKANTNNFDHEIIEPSYTPHLEYANIKSTPKRWEVEKVTSNKKKPSIAKTELQMQRLSIEGEHLRDQKNNEKQLKKLEEKFFITHLVIKKMINKNQMNSNFIKKCLIIISVLQGSLELLILKHSPTTILRVSNRKPKDESIAG